MICYYYKFRHFCVYLILWFFKKGQKWEISYCDFSEICIQLCVFDIKLKVLIVSCHLLHINKNLTVIFKLRVQQLPKYPKDFNSYHNYQNILHILKVIAIHKLVYVKYAGWISVYIPQREVKFWDLFGLLLHVL